MPRVAGVDEVGRGSLAGPVVAAAVILPDDFKTPLKDSKKLTASRRDKLAALIKSEALAFAVAAQSNRSIDCINILQASLLAMRQAVTALEVIPDHVIVDGNRLFNCDRLPPAFAKTKFESQIQADQSVACVQAAAIVAKVYRDHWMTRLHQAFPLYGFAKHKGYGTLQHRQALLQYGLSPIHRLSFSPCCDMV